MKTRVLIAGGGVAAVETALALHELCAERVSVVACSPSHEFVYRPYAVGEPFGSARVASYEVAELFARCDAEFQLASIVSVDAERRRAITHEGDRCGFDFLVLAPGVHRFWPVQRATSFWGIADDLGVADVIADLRSGAIESLAFTMPGTSSWALPMYELALLARADLAADGVEPRLTVVTPEDAPLEVFGRRASELVAALLAERQIEVLTRRRPLRFQHGRLLTSTGQDLDVDAAVSLPQLEGRQIHGVPHDPFGFIRTDAHCRLLDSERLYAAGDVTAFPAKQGGIATQHADVIAQSIAAAVGIDVEPQPFDPTLRAELWTGERSFYLEGQGDGGRLERSSLTAKPPWERHVGKIVGHYLSEFIAAVDGSGVAAAT